MENIINSQTMKDLSAVVLDKTRTITKGEPEVRKEDSY